MRQPFAWLKWLAVACSAASAFGALTVSPSSLAPGVVGVPYTANLSASGGTAPYAFSVFGLPPGLGLDGSQITGTPTVAGASSVTISVTDSATSRASNVNIPLVITATPPTITTNSLGSGTVGVAYTAGLGATGGTAPYTFSASGLPNGLSVNGSQITGTPTVAGASNVSITVTDAANGTATKNNLSLVINPPPLSVTTGSLGSGTVGAPYNAGLGATGGTPPYTFSASGLPNGLNVNGSQITGTPTASGSSNVSITVTDSASRTATKNNLTLVINPASLTVTTNSLPSGTVGAQYAASLGATGGTGPYTFSASGLPNGLNVNGSQITGTPTGAGSSNVSITVTDATSGTATRNNLTLVINPASLTVTTNSLPSGTVGTQYAASLGATGGTGPYTFSASGLPNGLSVNGSQITGTPTGTGSSNVSITVTDATSGTATRNNLTLVINPASLTVTTNSLPSGTVGAQYAASLGATGGTGPYTFSASGLPNGLSVNGSQITGTPTGAGSSNVSITVTDATSGTATRNNLTLVVNPASLNVTTNSLPSGTVGAQYAASLGATGGTGPYTFSASGLPNGLSVNGSQITGTPTGTGTSNVSITVTDATSGTATRNNLTLVINPASLTVTTNNLPSGTVGANYNASLGATGGTAPYSFSASGLPNGLSVNGSQITGAPTDAGTSNISITVTDSTSGRATRNNLSLVINPASLAVSTSSLPSGTVGAQYNASLGATGGTGPYTFSASGLPNGLSVNGSQITGTPTVAGTSNVSVTVTDSTNGTATRNNLSLVINPASLAVSTSSLPSGTVGAQYSASLGATGGTGPYTFSASGLPNGLSVNGSQITGTPTTAGTSNVSVTVTDSTNGTATRNNLSLVINPASLSVATNSLPSGTVGAQYNASLGATGGTGPYTFSASGLPNGLSVNGSQITGTPTTAGTSNVSVTVTDSTNGTATRNNLSLVINPASLAVATNSLPSGTVGAQYSASLGATGGTGPYTFSASGLPNGLSVNGSQITGTPTTAGTSNISITVTDSTNGTATRNNLSLVINPASLTGTTSSLASGTVGVPYTASLGATGGTAPYAFSATGLPDGLGVNGSQITGTPTVAGTSNVSITVTDSANVRATNLNIPLVINPATLTVTTNSLASGVAGTAYSTSLGATGGVSPYTFSASGLPNGLSVNGNQITGTPTSAGTSNVTITATDSASPANTASKTLQLAINGPALAVSTASLDSGVAGSAYAIDLGATGGRSPYTFSATGLPNGLSVNGNQITGTPTSAGISNVTITVTDSATPANTATKTLQLVINAPTLTVSTASLNSGVAGSPYSTSLGATGGVSPYTFSASGLPNGLSVNGNQISGTPTSPGASSVTITVTDSATPANTASKTLQLVIGTPALAVSTASLSSGVAGSPYSTSLGATGGVSPYTFSASGLPNGLSVNGNQITGTPTSPGTSSVTITVTDSATPANTASKTLQLAIGGTALAISTSGLSTGVVGTAYATGLAATGGVGAYSFSAAGLPTGLSVNGNQISGIPTSAGTSSVTVTVNDSASPANSATKTFSLVVSNPPLSITTPSLASGTVGTSYTALLGATGGTTPYSFSASGLPSGLSVSGSQIVGTPQNAGTASVTVTATDASNPSNTASRTLSLVITNPPLVLSTSNLPDGTVGLAYSTTLGASGGNGSFTFSASGLPSGLSVSGNQISGTPSASGTFNVTLQVKDSASPAGAASKTVQLIINNAPVTIGASSLPNGTVGSSYSQSLSASGGTGTFSWSITSGSLPQGLGLNGNQISGTPTTAGPTTFTVKATDTANASSTQALAITINPAPVTVTTSSLPNGTAGSPYSATVGAAGGNGTYSFSLVNGSLPAGLTLAGNLISGTASSPGNANFTVKATDTANSFGTQALTLTIDPAPVNLVTSSLANGTVGTNYLQSLSATGGAGSYVYSLSSGSLPAGLSLNGNQIGGTPSSPGTANFSVKVVDAANPNAFATKSLAITIFAGLTIATCPSSSATVAQPYSAGLSGSGGVPPYQWSVGAGQLPPGLSLDAGSGQITGTPAQAGPFSFNIKLNDNGGSTTNQNCSITVAAALAVNQGSLSDGSQGSNYSQTLSATGGQPPYTWTVAGGSLPPGVSLGSAGQLIGVPTADGSFAFTVRVTDSAGASASGNFNIRISAGLSIGSCPGASALPNQPYSSTLTGAGGQPPYAFSISGQLPAGLTLDGRTGAISGIPTQSGAVSFTIALSDGASPAATKPCSIVVSQAVVVNSASLPPATVGGNYSQQLTATGGTAPYTWSIASGALPPGLSLSSGGQISGSATTSGSFAFVARASDSAGGSGSASLSILVAGSISIGTCPAPTAISGQGYNGIFIVTGGQPPYSFNVSSGLLPAGVRLNSILGTISGAPVDLGNYNYTVQAVDKTGAQGSISCTINVTAGLAISNTFVADATVRSQYSQVLQATGGQPPYTYSIAQGALPSGLTLDASSGLISGTPASPGVFAFTAAVNDSGGATVQKQFSIAVSAGLVIPACPTQVGELGFAYAASVNAAGGSPPYTFSSTGNVPPGLTFDPTANAITGTPTQSGVFPFRILAVDKAGANVNRDCSLDIRAAVRIVNDTLPTGAGGASYLAALSASGGVPPYTWSTSAGALPPGLFLNAGTGQISGTPTISGNYSFQAQITDSIGAQTTKDFSISITQGLAIVDCPTPAAILGLPYSSSLTAVGGNGPFAWSVSAGDLPPGLTLQSNAALVSGSPTDLGLYNFTLRVDDAVSRSATRSCSIQVSTGNLGFTTSPTLPAALTGVAYSQTIGVSGGTAPYTLTLRDGKLPDGITLDSNGKLSGTVSAPGSYQFTIELTDTDGNSMRQVFTLVVQPGTAPAARITGLPDIIAPAQQPLFDLQLDSAYPLAITGSITLTFVPDPDVQVNDPAIQFATGGRTINFSVPANSTRVTFAAPIAALQTGTVAGTITLTVKMTANGTEITPIPAPSRSIRVDRLAPKISGVTLVKNATGVTLNIIGYSTTRDVVQGTFRFTTSGGTTTDVTVPVSDGAKAWFQSSGSAAFGGQFTLSQPFTFQGGTPAITSIAVTLSNGQGVSAPATVNF